MSCAKMNSTKVGYFGNTQSKVGIRITSYYIFFCFIYESISFFTRVKFISRNIKSKIKNVCFAKYRKSYKITSEVIKYASQSAKCEVRIRSLKVDKHFVN